MNEQSEIALKQIVNAHGMVTVLFALIKLAEARGRTTKKSDNADWSPLPPCSCLRRTAGHCSRRSH